MALSGQCDNQCVINVLLYLFVVVIVVVDVFQCIVIISVYFFQDSSTTTSKKIKPKDVPGTLLNMVRHYVVLNIKAIFTVIDYIQTLRNLKKFTCAFVLSYVCLLHITRY